MVFYRVERSTDGGTDYEELESGTLETGYLDPSPPAGGRVFYRVTPYNAAGEGPSRAVALILAPAPANTQATGAPTVSGTAQVGETLTADTSAITDADGLEDAVFTYQWIRNDGTEDAEIADATGVDYTLVEDDVGQTLKVRVSFTDGAGHEESRTSPPTAAVTAPPLTATLDSVPASHDGATEFTFELHFSEEFKLSYTVLRDDAFTVTGGTITKATRVKKGFNIKRKIQVKPGGDGAVTIVLPVTTDCAAEGAICTVDGRKLSTRLELTVSGPGGAPATTDEPAPNTQATGAPTISGMTQVGETLTADVTGIADEDGLDNPGFTYQWARNDGATDTNIQDATGSSYTLTKAEQGKTVTVTVTFTDDAGHEETRTSDPTGAVAAAANSAATGAPTISGTARVGETLTASTAAIVDGDGLDTAVFSYQWLADDVAIQDATGSSYTLVSDDEGKAVTVTVTFTDDVDHQESRTSAATAAVAAAANSRATGAPTITGTAQVGETLTADTSGIVDADGLDTATFSYQWRAGDVAIAGASGSSYTLTKAEQGQTVTLTVTFTDDAGHEETRTSAATAAVAAKPNIQATGAPSISGTAQVGQTLTADTSGIADADGLDTATFSYQWLADDLDIAGATGSGYTLTSAEQGKTVKVKVSFTDDAGHEESLTSDPTGAVEAAANSHATGQPTISGTVRVGETLTAGISGIADTDGLTTVSYSYQWLADDVAITGASGSSYTLTKAEQGKTVTLTVTFTDDAGHEETRTSDPTGAVAAAANSAATGAPTISGTARVGETLTASTSAIVDADGLDAATFSYQWLADDLAIQDATGSGYTLTSAEQGKTVTVTVSFTDDAGHQESLPSAATAAVAAAANIQATGAPTINGTAQVGETLTASTAGIADADGLDTAVFSYQWRADDVAIAGASSSSYTLTGAEQGKAVTVKVTFTDDAGHQETRTSAATAAVAIPVPDDPQKLAAKALAQGINLTWSAPDGSVVTGYVVYRGILQNGSMNGRAMSVYDDIEATGADMAYTDADVEAGVEYRYRVAGVNSSGEGGKSGWVNIRAKS